MNHRRLLEQLGTNAELGAIFGLDHSTISVWRVRGIPPHAWGAVVRLAREREIVVTLEQLEAASPRWGKHGPARIDRKRVPARMLTTGGE